MSWDATLVLDIKVDGNDLHLVQGDWNYTHNCNEMIYDALGVERDQVKKHFLVGYTWWDLLDGKGGEEGAELLTGIIEALEAEPEKYRAMNPENGWGSYDSLIEVLTEMRDTGRKWPSAKWSCSG